MIKNGHAVTLRKEYPHWRIWNPNDDPEKIVDGDLFTDLSKEEQHFIKDWVFANFESASTYKCKSNHNSYWWKHRFEELIGHYVSNNQAKDAFLSWGFEPENEHALNWTFKLKKIKDGTWKKN